MITDIKKILTELSYRVRDGSPDFENEQHLIKLYDVLKEYHWPIDARVELIKTLTLTEGTWWDKLDGPGKAKYIAKHGGPPKHRDAKDLGDTKDKQSTQDKPSKKSKPKQDKKDKKEKPEKKSEPQKPSEEQQQEKDKINVAVKEDLDFILEHSEDVRTQGGAGSNTPTKQQIKDMHKFYEERAKQDARRKEAEEKGEPFDEEPYVHPNVVQREIDDETLDKSIEYLKEKLGPEEFEKLMRFISKGGAVADFLTKITIQMA